MYRYEEVASEYESAHTLLEGVSFFRGFSKQAGHKAKTKAELETQQFWDELPDKDFSPKVGL